MDSRKTPEQDRLDEKLSLGLDCSLCGPDGAQRANIAQVVIVRCLEAVASRRQDMAPNCGLLRQLQSCLLMKR